MASRVLNVSWNESNTEGLFLPELAEVMKEKEKTQNNDPLEFPVCTFMIKCYLDNLKKNKYQHKFINL